MTAEDLFRCDLERGELDDLEIVADSGGSVDARTLRRLLDALASANAVMEGEDERQEEAIEEALREAGEAEAKLEALITSLEANASRRTWQKVMKRAFEECMVCLEPEGQLCSRHGKYVMDQRKPRKAKLMIMRGGKG